MSDAFGLPGSETGYRPPHDRRSGILLWVALGGVLLLAMLLLPRAVADLIWPFNFLILGTGMLRNPRRGFDRPGRRARRVIRAAGLLLMIGAVAVATLQIQAMLQAPLLPLLRHYAPLAIALGGMLCCVLLLLERTPDDAAPGQISYWRPAALLGLIVSVAIAAFQIQSLFFPE